MKKSIKYTILPVTALSLLLGGCGTQSKDDTLVESKAGNVKTEDVMKQIGNEQISKSAFQLILNKTLEKEYGDKVKDKDINEKLDKQKQQLGGEDKFKQALKQQNISEDDFKDQLKIQEYQKLLLSDSVKISDKELKDNTMKASHILIESSEDSNKKKKQAEDIKNQLDDGANFADLASKHSDDTQSKESGGSLGYIVKGQMDKEFDKAAFKLKENKISNVVKTNYGYHIIKANKESDFDKHKDELKQTMIQQKIQEDPSILTDAYEKLLKKYKVKYEDKDIKKYINSNLLNGDKLKEQASQQQMQQSSQSQMNMQE